MINIKIKFFPANFSLYLYTLLINLFFLIIFTINIFWIIAENTQVSKDSRVLLIIPKNFIDTEEQRDLIFNQLSLNNEIISVEAEDIKKVKILLSDILEDTDLNEEIIPEVYNLIVKSEKRLDLDGLNHKISQIIPGARIFSTYSSANLYLKKPYILLFFLIFVFVMTNYFLINSIIFNIKNYLNLSRNFGVNDLTLFRNLNIGFFFIIFLSSLFCNSIYFLFINVGEDSFLTFDKNLYIYISYYLFFLLNFNIQLYSFLKKII